MPPNPARVDLFDLTAPDVTVPWPVRMVAARSVPAAAGDALLVDLSDRPGPGALDALRGLTRGLTRGGARAVAARVFASWDGSVGDPCAETLRDCLGLVETLLVGSRSHLVHLASRGVLERVGEIRIEAPRIELAPAAGSTGVLDCRLDRAPHASATAVARSADEFDRALAGAGTVLLTVERPLGDGALVRALLASGRRVITTLTSLEGADLRPRGGLVLLDEAAADDAWLDAPAA